MLLLTLKFKSLLSFLLFLLSSAVFAVETVTVDDGEYKGWVFIKNGDGTYSLISIPGDYEPAGGVLTIPYKINDITVSGVVAQDTVGVSKSLSPYSSSAGSQAAAF